MEARRLLANDFFGAVGGNVFTDLTENGLDAGDTAIAGATVRLHQDNNTDGVLDGGDTLLSTQITDANGDYLFPNLQNGQYLVEQLAVTGQLQRTTESVKVAVVSNDAGTPTQTLDNLETVTTPDPLTAAAGATESDQQTTPTTEVLGGERDVVVSNDGGSGSNLTFDIDAGGAVIIDAGVATTGSVEIIYDGVDGDAATIGHNLGGVDLTANNGMAFQFRVGSQVGSFLTVEVYSGDNLTASSLQLVLPTTAGGAATEDLHFCFDDFTRLAGATADADFTNVSAIRVIANMAAADDIAIDFVGVNGLDVTTTNFANLNPMSLGDLVFQDTDNDGALDAGETGIAGVAVQLFEDTNANGSFDNGTDTQVATTTTDANGNYLFSDLLPAEYIVLIPISEFGAGNVLEGFESSSGNDPAPDPDNDVNSDDNGTLIAGVGVASAAMTLAAGAEPTDDGDTSADTNLSLDFGFATQVDLSVTKTANASSVIAGNQLTYTLNVANNGDSAATNVVLVDNLPDLSPTPLSIISTTSTLGGTITQTGNSTGEIEVAYGTLAAGATDTVTIVVEVPDSAAAATAVTNVATISGDETESNVDNNTSQVDVAITRNAVLQVTKTDSPDPNSVGSSLTYSIVVTNTGPSTATNVAVSDTLDSGLTFNTVNTTQGTAGESNGVVTATIPTLAVGSSATITVNSTINSSFTGASIDNTVTAVADEATQATATANTTVNPQVDLAITKSDNIDPATRGGQLVYTLDVVNNGPSQATNVEVVDTLPTGVSFVSATGGTVTPPANGSQDVTINLGTMAASETRQITITVDVDTDAPDTITNNATVQSTEGTNGFDSNTANNSTSEPTTLDPAIDLQVVKTDSPDSVNAGENLVYTMVVTNNGPSSATNVQLTDTLPAGVTFSSATSDTGSTPTNNNGVVTADIGTLASGAQATVTITVTVDSTTTGTLVNSASVTGTETDTNTTNNTDSEETTVATSVDLQITKTESSASVRTGDTLTYEIIVTNNGPSTATSVQMTDTVPADLQVNSVVTTLGTASNNGNDVTVDVGTLDPAQSATITVTTTVIGTTTGTISNTASVTAAEAEADTTNNSATEATELAPEALSKRFLLSSTV